MALNKSLPANHPDLGFEERLSQWWDAVGFKRNPFLGDSKPHAENEPYLVEYFYPVGFEEMIARNSAVFYAPQGGGKTANRRMVEDFCTVGATGKIFSVVYDDFQRVIEQAEGALASVTARMHVEAILRDAAPRLFDHLVQNPEPVEDLKYVAYLRQFVRQFTDCLTDYRLNQVLKGTGITREDIVDALERQDIHSLLKGLVEDYRPRVQLMATLLAPRTAEVVLDELTPTQLLESFFDLVETVGFGAIFILVDNVDGLPETVGDPQACVTLLRPIVGTRSLMRLPGVFFKFYLPPDARSLLDEKFDAFSRRRVRPIEVDWPDEKLHEVLRERLKAATQEGRPPITSFDLVSEERLRGKIDNELVKYSQTPRDLVLLGREVFQVHIRQSPEKEYITDADLELALASQKKEEQLQRRQDLWHRVVKWGGGGLAVIFAIVSLLTWMLFLLPLHTPATDVPNASLSVFAKHPRCIPVGGEGEVSVTVSNDGTAEITSTRASLIFTPTCPIEFPEGNGVEFDSLPEGAINTQNISFRPLEAQSTLFDLRVQVAGSVDEVVGGGVIRVVPIPNALVRYFFVQPLLFSVGAVVAALSKQISEVISRLVGEIEGFQLSTDGSKQ